MLQSYKGRKIYHKLFYQDSVPPLAVWPPVCIATSCLTNHQLFDQPPPLWSTTTPLIYHQLFHQPPCLTDQPVPPTSLINLFSDRIGGLLFKLQINVTVIIWFQPVQYYLLCKWWYFSYFIHSIPVQTWFALNDGILWRRKKNRSAVKPGVKGVAL